MEKSELLIKLIEYYENAIKEIPQNEWKNYVEEKMLEYGICNCSNKIFKTRIYHTDWVRNLSKMSAYFAKPIHLAKTQSEAIELLQIRVDIMKQELSTII